MVAQLRKQRKIVFNSTKVVECNLCDRMEAFNGLTEKFVTETMHFYSNILFEQVAAILFASFCKSSSIWGDW